jgi:alpha-beta hydrolase superfamily lysophospholipase
MILARPRGSRELFDEAGSADKTLKPRPGLLHDPLNALGNETVLADIRAWLQAPIGTASRYAASGARRAQARDPM